MSEAVQTPVDDLAGTDIPLHCLHDLVLLDLDGVVYIGPDAVPGAAPVLDAVRAAGSVVRFVTNNASRPPEAISDHLTRLGIPASPDEVVTSAQVAAALLARRLPAGAGVLVVGGEGLRRAIECEGLVPMDRVDDGPSAVVQGFGPDVGWRLLSEASRAVRSGLYWMATNLDLTVPTVHGPAPGNGSLVWAVETAAGRGPDQVAGKPRPGAFVEAARRIGARRPVVVGDRLDTDVEGARAAGMPALLVLTGITGVTELLAAARGSRPMYVGRSVAALLERHPAGTAEGQSGSAAVGTCAGSRARAHREGERVVVRVLTGGDDPLDLVRAAAVATWRVLDGGTSATVDATEILATVRMVEPGVTWAR